MGDARWEHAVFAKAGVYNPRVLGDAVAPVVSVVVVFLLAAAVVAVVTVADTEGFAAFRVVI